MAGELRAPTVTEQTLIMVRPSDSALRKCWVQPLPAEGEVRTPASLQTAALLNKAAAIASGLHVHIPTFRVVKDATARPQGGRLQGGEETDDEAFEQRHRKLEYNERKLVRRDRERVRFEVRPSRTLATILRLATSIPAPNVRSHP